MPQNYDDYYSSIPSQEAQETTEDISQTKRKIKVKVKKPQEEIKESFQNIEVQKENLGEKEENIEKEEVREKGELKKENLSLNEALEKNKKESRFKVVSRQEEKTQEKIPEKKEKFGEKKTSVFQEKKFQARQEIKKEEKTENNVSTENINSHAKFKPGFAKNKALPGKGKNGNFSEEENKKKGKIFGSSKAKGEKHIKYLSEEEDASFVRSTKIKQKKKQEKNIENVQQHLTERTGEIVSIPDILSLKEFSEKIGVPLPKLIAEFMKNGMMMNINSQLDFDTMSLIAEVFEVKLEKQLGSGMSAEEIVSGNIKNLLIEEDVSKLEERPPVVSIMGHVDHGKTSLLDYIRKSRVAAGEAGGITQSIGAYQVEYNDKKITFLDTPGHEAFTIMRSRGAKSTDIAILVVAADEGVKPQTIESISHAKEAGIPVIVAINKMDKEGANPDHVKAGLSEHGLIPEDWGGDTPMVPVSAHSGFGVSELLEMILLVAEMLELKANPHRNGIATIIESHLDAQLGPVATALINTGNIEKTSAVVCGDSFGKVKILKDYTGQAVKIAYPGDPILIVGLDKVVEGGDILQVVSGIDVAREKAGDFSEYISNQKKAKASQLDILMGKIKSGNLKHLKVVVKADTNGSLEAMKNALLKLSTPETSVSIIHSGVGNITEGDVLMCGGSSALLIGFNVSVGANAKSVLEESGVEYIESKIIYHITERIEKIVSGMLDPKEVEIKMCEAKVGGIFYSSKNFIILGLQLKREGEFIEKGASVRVIRGDKIIGKGKIENLKQGVEEVQKLEGPIECGIKFSGFLGVEEKDILEVYKIIIEK